MTRPRTAPRASGGRTARAPARWVRHPIVLVAGGAAIGALAGAALGHRVVHRYGRLCRGPADEVALAVQRERRRIARELHDAVGHGLVVIAMHSRRLPAVSAQAQSVARLIDETAQATLRDMRQIIGTLRGAPEPGGWLLSQRAAELVGRMPDGRAVELEVTGREPPLPLDLRTTALHVVQESLANALKHGGGRLRVLIEYGDELRITVTDEGGRPPGEGWAGPGGQGLRGLVETVTARGGSFTFGRPPGDGFLVRARLPLPAARRPPGAPSGAPSGALSGLPAGSGAGAPGNGPGEAAGGASSDVMAHRP
ncbi:histidine kinase [Actinomadura sp. NBRC 104425]|uniref:sensor histidine kinase n=1 Tax=Actinomadura sp. NBRC 104425 TaxID=3032204 RepID=UPI0025549190|nr:histidine kinase [Actinomadura sp. NBRC 104425]